MTDIVVNGQKRKSEAATLADLWRDETAHLDIEGPRGFAIALNGRVVRHVDWSTTPVTSGDKVEIIRAMPGG
jgi:sulfur carrier protein